MNGLNVLFFIMSVIFLIDGLYRLKRRKEQGTRDLDVESLSIYFYTIVSALFVVGTIIAIIFQWIF
jgi:uncharacterized membrane protein YidH (DUF202 family)